MLKATYTDTGIFLEKLTESVEGLVIQRVVLNLRLGNRLVVESSYASLLLPADLSGVTELEAIAQKLSPEILQLDSCDSEWVEVTLRGTWITTAADGDEGVFAVELEANAECCLFELWRRSQSQSAGLINPAARSR